MAVVHSTILAALVVCGCASSQNQGGAGAVSSSVVSSSTAASATGSVSAVGGSDLGTDGGDRFPNVLSASVTKSTDNTYVVEATLSSPYDTPQRYANAWRVVDLAGNVLGVRELAHDHQTEQPFTRTLEGVVIPAGVDVVFIEGRDQANGWGGLRVQVAVS
jgi:hypothetical protein